MFVIFNAGGPTWCIRTKPSYGGVFDGLDWTTEVVAYTWTATTWDTKYPDAQLDSTDDPDTAAYDNEHAAILAAVDALLTYERENQR